MIKACAWFNIIFGILVVGLVLLAVLGFVLISISLGSGPILSCELLEVFMFCAPLAVAGVLYVFSGLFLRQSDARSLAKAILFQGSALAIAVLVSIGLWFYNPQENLMLKPLDHLEFFLPAGFLLFGMIESAYLGACWSARGIADG